MKNNQSVYLINNATFLYRTHPGWHNEDILAKRARRHSSRRAAWRARDWIAARMDGTELSGWFTLRDKCTLLGKSAQCPLAYVYATWYYLL